MNELLEISTNTNRNINKLWTNNNYPMSEQKKIIEQEFLKWIGNADQIDDVTVFGIKI